MNQIVEIVDKVQDTLLTSNKRHKIIVGGRGKGASWSIARILLTQGMGQPMFIPCVREIQKSIKYSVKKLLDDTIDRLGWQWFYKSTNTEIRGLNDTTFAFFGLQEHNADSIKSLEGAHACWVAEAQSLSRQSINILRPTIRLDGSVMWWDFNPRYETDPIYYDYITNVDDTAEVLWLNWSDNPWFNETLRNEREQDYKRDKKEAEHIWEGKLRDMGERYVCPSGLVDIAMNNDILQPAGKLVVGADIAHQGGDEIVFYKRFGNATIETFKETFLSVPETVGLLKQFCGDKSVIINIDNGHVGAAVADYMIKSGYIINRINFGGKPKDIEHYEDTVTEMYFELRDKLPYIDIPKDEELRGQLIQRKWLHINGKRGYEVMKIESKGDFSDHAVNIHPSPDRADALVLCYYTPIFSDAAHTTIKHNVLA